MFRVRSLSLSALAAALVLLPGIATAQAPDQAPPEVGNLNLEQREACLSHYRYGSVTFTIDNADTPQRLAPGDILTLSGTVENINRYPLSDGRIITRFLRHDESVAAENWHPVIDEVTVEGIELAGSGTSPFEVTWQVPARAPAGIYRAEFFYLAGQRYAMAGLPYVANAAGGSLLFTVTDGGASSAVTFDRSQVLLQDEPLTLRSVPPELAPNVPITVSVPLTAQSDEPMPVTLHQALYEWSDTDLEPAVFEAQETVVVNPGQPHLVTFTWPNSVPGVYELVMTATPQRAHVTPSIIKVRFPVTGTVPRIIYSGLGNPDENGNAQIITCSVNGTFGATGGNITTRVLAGGREVASQTSHTNDELTTLTIPVSQGELAGNTIEVFTEARDQNGNITDSHGISYSPDLIRTAEAAEAGGGAGSAASTRAWIAVISLLAIIILAGAGIAAWRTSRKPPFPNDPTLNS